MRVAAPIGLLTVLALPGCGARGATRSGAFAGVPALGPRGGAVRYSAPSAGHDPLPKAA